MFKLPRYTEPIVVGPALWGRLADMLERALNMSASPPLMISNDARGLHLSLAIEGAQSFWAFVASPSRDGDNWRWSYTFTEVKKNSTGYGGWTALTGGRTGTAYNTIEDMNGESGLMGNGVNTDNLSDTEMTVQPCPANTPVRMYLVTASDGTPEYWFSYENAIDGTC